MNSSILRLISLSLLSVGALSLLLPFTGCEPPKPRPSVVAPEEDTKGQPSRIMVQHCLIGFQGSLPGPTRTKEEAKELAESLFQKLKEGANFDDIIKEYTNDRPPGIYKMVNHGVPDDERSGSSARNSMVPAFGDVGFNLKVDEYGMSEYDPVKSPFGWHIIKRLE
jgi:hypothetical protein